MELRKWFCETHQMWFNESCELCERSSPESGGRRQEAENDTGSEWSSEYHATEICTLFGHGHFDKVVEYLDKLRNGVSARSADSPAVTISFTNHALQRIEERFGTDSDELVPWEALFSFGDEARKDAWFRVKTEVATFVCKREAETVLIVTAY